MKPSVVFVLQAVLCLAPLCAQVNKGNLTGVVRDSSGAVVPGATLRLVNVGTGAVRSETTGQEGIYRFMLLDLGMYRLDVEATGFKTFIRRNIE
jgi:hypothetical protein